jgi:hypothetical protein
MENTSFKYRITFCKCWTGRMLSHLDMMRGWSRALRRTGMPVYFTQGFNPRPQVSYLTPPLGLGQTSECETIGFRFEQDVMIERLREELATKTPTGTIFLDVAPAPGEKLKFSRIDYLLLAQDEDLETNSLNKESLLEIEPGLFEEPPREIAIGECGGYRITFSGRHDPLQFFNRAFLLSVVHNPERGSPTKTIGAHLAALDAPYHFHRIKFA